MIKNSYIGYDQGGGKLLSKQNKQVAPEIKIGRELLEGQVGIIGRYYGGNCSYDLDQDRKKIYEKL